MMIDLQILKRRSEEELGFKSTIVLRAMSMLESQTTPSIPSILQVDDTGLVVVKIMPGRSEVRDYRVVAYEGKGLSDMLASSEFLALSALQRVGDMSSACFAKIPTS